MNITYTAPNRSHHYPYAEAINRAGHLYAFISGFSRFSPRSPLPSLGEKLKRHDFMKNIHIASLKVGAPRCLSNMLDRISARSLDKVSYKWAKKSDIFIYYRTEGFKTTQKLRKNGHPTLCVMEEVNSHVEFADQILRLEFEQLKSKGKYYRDSDYDLRLRAYEQADYILCPSNFVRRSFLDKGFSPERLITVNFGFPPIDEKALYPKTKNSKFRILYVGQLHFRKGLRFAIDAFARLDHPGKEFVLVGPKTSTTGLEGISFPKGVIFTGPLKGDQLKKQYELASVFILPSLEEGLSLVQGEALAAGLPLITTTNTGGEDIIQNGIEGFIVDPGNATQLFNSLQRLADDENLRQKMSFEALRTANRLGSWDNAAESLLAHFRRLPKIH